MGSSVILPTPGQPVTGADPSFRSLTLPNLVTFGIKDLTPPSDLYLQRDDLMFFRVWTSVPGLNVGLHVRVLDTNGVIFAGDYPTFPTSNRALNSTTFQLTEGFLLSAVCFLAGATVRRGQCFVQVGVVRGAPPTTFVVAGLISDYLVSPEFLPWPGGKWIQPLEGPGARLTITGSVPAAGADIVQTVPTNARWKVVSLRASLTSSAAAGNRNVTAFLGAAGSTYFRGPSNLNQIAGTTQAYSASPLTISGLQLAGDAQLPFAPDAYLLAGDQFGTSTTGLLAGDQWAAPVFQVEEWIETT